MTNTNPVIECQLVFKIFGDETKQLLQANNNEVDQKKFEEHGCIFGVNDVSLKVSK